MITDYYSHKIRVLNMVLIIMVLYIHGYYLEAEAYPFASSFQLLGSGNGLNCVANGLFFLFSGILFFNGIQSWKDCLPKMKRRVKSLLVPYIIWNIIFVLWYVVLQNLPGLGDFINSDVLKDLTSGGFGKCLYMLLWQPVNFPLWFLRDLMIMVAVSTLLFYVVKYLKWSAPVLLVLVSPIISSHISPFYVLGGCISIHSSLEQISSMLNKRIITIIAAVVYFGNAIAQIFTDYHHPYISFVVTLCGIIIIWKLYDCFESKRKNCPSATNCLHIEYPHQRYILGYSFFIFLFHEPTFNIIKKLGLKILGIHEWSLIVLYLINPVVMCSVAILVAKLMQRFVPKIYSVLVGGR